MPETFEIGLGNNNRELRQKSESDYVKFWEEQAKNLSWFTRWKETLKWNPPFAKWFEGGLINASFNALDVHSTH